MEKFTIDKHNELMSKASDIIEALEPYKEILQGGVAIKSISIAMGNINELYRLNFKPTSISNDDESSEIITEK